MDTIVKIENARACLKVLIKRESEASDSLSLSKARASRHEMQAYLSQLHRQRRHEK